MINGCAKWGTITSTLSSIKFSEALLRVFMATTQEPVRSFFVTCAVCVWVNEKTAWDGGRQKFIRTNRHNWRGGLEKVEGGGASGIIKKKVEKAVALISSTTSWPACPLTLHYPSFISMVMLQATRAHFHNFLRQANRDITAQKNKRCVYTHVVYQLYARPRRIKVRLSGFCARVWVSKGEGEWQKQPVM